MQLCQLLSPVLHIRHLAWKATSHTAIKPNQVEQEDRSATHTATLAAAPSHPHPRPSPSPSSFFHPSGHKLNPAAASNPAETVVIVRTVQFALGLGEIID